MLSISYSEEPILNSQLSTLNSQETTEYKINSTRFAIVTGSVGASYAAIYFFFLKEGWWSESGSFHFEQLYSDMNYASNLDKFGHFYTGSLFSEIFAMSYDWTGMSPFASSLWAAATVGVTQILVEIKDGFSPYGYSVWDAAAGCLGGFYAMGKRFIPAMQYVDYKFAYWPRTSLYRDEVEGRDKVHGDIIAAGELFVDDYYGGNQTHWLSFKVGKMLPASAKAYYPQWLAFAFGWGLDDGAFEWDSENERYKLRQPTGWEDSRYEFYLALDYDLEAIFNPKKTWSKNLVTILNFIKFPAPTYRIGSRKDRTGFSLLFPLQFSIFGSV